MLRHLYIENVAIIKKAFINFSEGLNVLIGETGSGKSIILDCIDFLTGGRARSDAVRNGEKRALIVAEFDCDNKDLILILKENLIEIPESEYISIKRIIYSDGKSSCFVCDVPVSLTFLAKISQYLIEVNGQFVRNRLFDINEHLKILDEYAKIGDDLRNLKNSYSNYQAKENKCKELLLIKDNIARDHEFYSWAIKDIEKLNLLENEENILLEKRGKIINKASSIKFVIDIVNGIQKTELIKNLRKTVKDVSLIKDNFFESELLETLEMIESYGIDFCDKADFLVEFAKKYKDIESEIEKIDDRIFEIKQICRKYNIQSDQILSFYNEIKNNTNIKENIDIELKKLEQEKDIALAEYYNISSSVSEKRKFASVEFIKQLQFELLNLKMENAKMNIDIIENKDSITATGINSIVFTVSMNIGTQFMPINKIASGGELSRFMLAFKSIISKKSKLPSIIFDEIESGTSGVVASIIAEYLLNLSKETQVIAVTHNHQTVKKSNSTIKISKIMSEHNTVVEVSVLSDKETEDEINIMISGVSQG